MVGGRLQEVTKSASTRTPMACRFVLITFDVPNSMRVLVWLTRQIKATLNVLFLKLAD